MRLNRLEHINVRTRNLDAMVEWYGRVLDMKSGKRPDFDFPGAWLYVGDSPFIHLVGVDRDLPAKQNELRLEHFALSAEGLKEFLAHLGANGVEAKLGKVPGFDLVQVNIWDPDGNHIHVDFHSDEAQGLTV